VTVPIFSRAPNPLNTRIIETKSLFERLEMLLRLGRGYIVFPGGSGTLVELALAWELANKNLEAARPLIFLGSYWEPVVNLLRRDPADVMQKPSDPAFPQRPGWVFTADDPESALAILEKHIPPQ
jgi:predicted Rossmann-fold nucleotide-binding protein